MLDLPSAHGVRVHSGSRRASREWDRRVSGRVLKASESSLIPDDRPATVTHESRYGGND